MANFSIWNVSQAAPFGLASLNMTDDQRQHCWVCGEWYLCLCGKDCIKCSPLPWKIRTPHLIQCFISPFHKFPKEIRDHPRWVIRDNQQWPCRNRINVPVSLVARLVWKKLNMYNFSREENLCWHQQPPYRQRKCPAAPRRGHDHLGVKTLSWKAWCLHRAFLDILHGHYRLYPCSEACFDDITVSSDAIPGWSGEWMVCPGSLRTAEILLPG